MLGISPGYYDTLKFLHVLASISWVGSAIYAQVLATKVMGEGRRGPHGLDGEGRRRSRRLITPSAIAVLVFGVWMVAVSDWNFSDTWILLGLIGIAITIVTGAGFLGPESERLARLGAERDPSDPDVQRRILRIFVISRIDLVVLVLVVAVMVFKPGS